MTKQKLIKQFVTVFGYCRAKSNWSPDFDDAPFDKLLNLGYDFFSKFGIWSYNQFNYLAIKKLKENNTKAKILNSDAEQIVDDIEKILRANLHDVFIILPLVDAQISKSVFFENFAIIKSGRQGLFPLGPSIPKNTVYSEIDSYFEIGSDKISEEIEYVIQNKSSGFLDYPLLIVRKHYFFDTVAQIDYSLFVLRFNLMFIRLLAQSKKVKKYNLTPQNSNKCDHFICIDKGVHNISFPIRDGLDCKYNLDFMLMPDSQASFLEMVKIFEMPSNALRSTYMRSIKFINKAFSGNDWAMDDISMRILFANISAESLLIFDTSGGKKRKLANVMVKLAAISRSNKNDYLNAVNEVYIDRSHFVHAGKQVLEKYSPDFESNKVESESLNKYLEMLMNILVNFPTIYNNLVTTYGQDAFDEWGKYLKSPSIVKKPSLIKKGLLQLGRFFNKIADKF